MDICTPCRQKHSYNGVMVHWKMDMIWNGIELPAYQLMRLLVIGVSCTATAWSLSPSKYPMHPPLQDAIPAGTVQRLLATLSPVVAIPPRIKIMYHVRKSNTR